MMFASRELTVRVNGQSQPVFVRFFAPERDAIGWICRLEIDWPEGTWSGYAPGFDQCHAVEMALQMAGARLYFSEHHEAGRLMWLEPGGGYGFPVPSNIKDVLQGQDRLRYG